MYNTFSKGFTFTSLILHSWQAGLRWTIGNRVVKRRVMELSKKRWEQTLRQAPAPPLMLEFIFSPIFWVLFLAPSWKKVTSTGTWSPPDAWVPATGGSVGLWAAAPSRLRQLISGSVGEREEDTICGRGEQGAGQGGSQREQPAPSTLRLTVLHTGQG